jgi:hypothetical protein
VHVRSLPRFRPLVAEAGRDADAVSFGLGDSSGKGLVLASATSPTLVRNAVAQSCRLGPFCIGGRGSGLACAGWRA